MKTLAVCSVLMFVVAAFPETALASDGSGAAADAVPVAANLAQRSTVVIPASFVFSPSIDIEATDSWSAFSARQGEGDRQVLEDVSARYSKVVEFNTPAEQEVLARNGFPMPEEWLVAAAMSREELGERASSGNVKAQMFYLDRLGDELLVLQKGRTDGSVPGGMSVERLIQSGRESLAAGARLMRSSGSPFAAHVYGRALSAASHGAPAEPIASAFFAARDRGDLRGAALMDTFAKAHRPLDVQSVLAIYSVMAGLKPDGAGTQD